MSHVTVVTGEHPYDSYYPLEVFASEASARARCAELTAEFLKAVWEIEEPDNPKPDATINNWSDIVDKLGFCGDMDGFGRWFVAMSTIEVKP